MITGERREPAPEPSKPRRLPPSAKLKALVQQAIDWAFEEERQQRHVAFFVIPSRVNGETSTITISPIEDSDNTAEAVRVATVAAAAPDVDAVVIGCWGPLEIKRQRMEGLILFAHERGAAEGAFFFQEMRTGWFRGVSAEGPPIHYSFRPQLAPWAPAPPPSAPRVVATSVEPVVSTCAITREEFARALDLFTTTPALRDYWEALERVGWLKAMPQQEHAALRMRLTNAHARNPTALHEGLPPVESIATLMVDQDTDEDEGSVTFLARDYATASFGAIILGRIRSTFVDPDADEEEELVDIDPDFVVVRISFEFRGRKIGMEIPFGESLEPVREVVNGILAEDGEPRRIFHVPAAYRNISCVFVPPDVYTAATKLGILPSDSSSGS
jgi:hypothetical protein